MAGSDRVPDPNDSKRAQVGTRKPQRERNGALLRVHAEVLLKTCLTLPTLLEIAMFRQQLEPACLSQPTCGIFGPARLRRVRRGPCLLSTFLRGDEMQETQRACSKPRT